MSSEFFENSRILVIDDEESIQDDFRKVLAPAPAANTLRTMERELFGDSTAAPAETTFELTTALQGTDGLAAAVAARKAGKPFAMAFVDMRMPPGWDGLETIEQLWKDDPRLQVVICTAHSDHSWAQILRRLGRSDRLLLLKKPFVSDEIRQLALMLTTKWSLARQAESTQADLMLQIDRRTSQLAAATRDAQAANAAKSEFLAKMTHEIRTPLNGVIGMTELLLETKLDHQQKLYADHARNAGKTLLSLVNEILDFSKIEAGKFELQTLDFDLRRVVEESIEMLRIAADKKRLQLSSIIDPQLPCKLRGDPHRLKQILINLLNNAIKFTDVGSVAMNVAPEPSSVPGVMVRFSVLDEGPGISKADLGRLFKSFSQLGTPASRRPEGTGLGLAISKQLAEAMGGNIGVEINGDRGTTFWFTANFQLQPDGQPESVTPISIPPVPMDNHQPPASAILPRRILVVEDNETNQIVAEQGLKNYGYSCTLVSNGLQAIEALQQEWFDLVLMDCQMPDMDGWETTRAIRHSEVKGGRHIPIIALTATATKDDRDRCIASGMDGYLTKPLDFRHLVETIENYLSENPEPLFCPISDRPAASSSPPLDLGDLLYRCTNDADFVQMLLGKFRQSLSKEFDALTNLIQDRDVPNILRKAHSLKGSAATVAAVRLKNLAGQVEDMARTADFEVADQCLSQLREEVDRILQYLPNIPSELAPKAQTNSVKA